MREDKSITITHYDTNKGYYVDIVCYPDKETPVLTYRNAWLCKYNYGIKMFMFGTQNTDIDTFIEMINNNIDLYIEDYEREYSDTQYDN